MKIKKQGISLIVLVITIIVMIVLAGAIILSLNNAGIIEKANQAVSSTDEATIKQIAQLGWAEAYAEYGPNLDKLEAGVKFALTENNIETEDYGIIVTTKGVTIGKGWQQGDFIVTKGSQKLEIGDVVYYDAGVEGYTSGWKVLGAENGELLIMSAADITEYGLGDYNHTEDIELAKAGYLNGISDLNTLCEEYGNGRGAVGKARSITVEDVNKITGYNPEIARHGKGTIEEYGNEVTLTWEYSETEYDLENPHYESTNGISGRLMDTESHEGRFMHFNGTEFLTLTNEGVTEEVNKEITTLKNNYYTYSLVNNPEQYKEGFKATKKAYKMLFKNNENELVDTYWLASRYTYVDTWCVCYGMFMMRQRVVAGTDFIDSLQAMPDGYSYGVRAVVSLGTDIKLTGSSTSGWSY